MRSSVHCIKHDRSVPARPGKPSARSPRWRRRCSNQLVSIVRSLDQLRQSCSRFRRRDGVRRSGPPSLIGSSAYRWCVVPISALSCLLMASCSTPAVRHSAPSSSRRMSHRPRRNQARGLSQPLARRLARAAAGDVSHIARSSSRYTSRRPKLVDANQSPRIPSRRRSFHGSGPRVGRS